MSAQGGDTIAGQAAPVAPAAPVARGPGARAAGPRTLLLVNRDSRRGADAANRALERLRAGGLAVREAGAGTVDEAAAAIRAHRSHVDRLVIGGGDGTLHNLLPAVLATGLPVGVLPLGTANDLARSLDVPASVDDACDVITRGHRRAIDLGYVNDRPFLNAANIGAGVALTRRLTGEGKRRWGVLGYALAAARTIRAVRPFEAEIACGAVTRVVHAIQITVGNGRHHGGLLTVSEDATLDDGTLHGYSLRPLRARQVPGALWALRTGRQRQADAADTFQGAEITVLTDRPMRIIADGEPAGTTPARFRVARGALVVFAAGPDVPAGPAPGRLRADE